MTSVVLLILLVGDCVQISKFSDQGLMDGEVSVLCQSWSPSGKVWIRFRVDGLDHGCSWSQTIQVRKVEVIAIAAMAAVSARRIRGPSVTGCQVCSVKRKISSGVQPPSGPMAMVCVVLVCPDFSNVSVRVVFCSVSLRRIRVEDFSCSRACLSGIGSAISGMSVRRDCLLASRAMRRQRSERLRADWARCFSVRRARMGVIRAMPSSVAFSMAHSM